MSALFGFYFLLAKKQGLFVLFPLTSEGPSCVRWKKDFKSEFLGTSGKQMQILASASTVEVSCRQETHGLVPLW